MVAISPQSPQVSSNFADELGVTFPILTDADQAVIHAYGVQDEETETAWPTVFVVDQTGKIVFMDTAATKNVEGRTKPADILAALAALRG